MRVRLSAEAEADLAQAVSWYLKVESRALGARFLQSVDAALERLSTGSAHGSPVPGVSERLRVRRLRLQDFPYFIILRELEDELQVLAFAHERRSPSYWRKRMRGGTEL